MYANLEEVDSRWRVRFSRRLAHSPETVWMALTEAEHLSAWFPTTIEGERAAGARLRFSFSPEEGYPPFEGEMLRYVPPTLLEYRWGDDTLRFELEADGNGCILTLTDTLAELGKASRDAAGWHVCLDNLARHLEGEPAGPPDAWKPVNESYVQRFRPEASTIGPPEGHPEA